MRDRILPLCLSVLACLLATPARSLEVSAKSAVVFDAASGRVLWSKDADIPRFPASTTKIMTSLLLIEHRLPTDIITAPKDTETVGGASLHMRPGEQITAREMLYAIMLRSANDACHAVALDIAGSDLAFADLMNQRAKELGCSNTFFHNPHGLNDDLHKISARDLGIIACEAMRYPEFREVVKQRKHLMVRSINQEDRWMINHNKWLWHDPTADGIKTGYTDPAGQCYVGSATRNGYRIITVILGSQDWRTDNIAMLNWAFSQFEPRRLLEAGSPVEVVKVRGGKSGKVKALLARGLTVLQPKGQTIELDRKVVWNRSIEAPIQAREKIGEFVLSDGQGWEKRIPILASSSIPRASFAQRAGSSLWRVTWIGGCIFVVGYVWRKRARRARRKYSYVRYR